MSSVDTTSVKDDDIVEITNLLDCTCGYVVDLTGVRRIFPPHASFKVKAGELRELSYQLGGQEVLQNYIRVGNKALAQEFGVDVDNTPEYNWGRKEVVDCLNNANIDVLLDALDFAPEGIKQLIEDVAVEIEVADTNKRKAISEKLGCDIDAMITNKHLAEKEDEPEEDKKPARRRTAAKKATTTGRRVKKTADAE